MQTLSGLKTLLKKRALSNYRLDDEDKEGIKNYIDIKSNAKNWNDYDIQNILYFLNKENLN